MSVGRHKLNTIISYAVRTAVGVHFACLYVLTFGLTYTLAGLNHYVAAVALTILMAAIVVLFVVDIMTRRDEKRSHSKLIDTVIGSAWVVVVGFLLLNNVRSGLW